MSIIDAYRMLKKVNNYAEDATTVTAFWINTTNCKFIVPAGKRWYLLGGIVSRDVSSTMDIRAWNTANKPIYYLSTKTAATGQTGYPDPGTGGQNVVFILDVGEYVMATFGTAQGAAAYVSCVVLEVDVV